MSALSRGLCTSVYPASRARAAAMPPSASVARAFAICSALCRSQHSPHREALVGRGSAQALSGQAGACAGPSAALPAARRTCWPATTRTRASACPNANRSAALAGWQQGCSSTGYRWPCQSRNSCGADSGAVKPACRPASCAMFAADCQIKRAIRGVGHAARACVGKEGCWYCGHTCSVAAGRAAP